MNDRDWMQEALKEAQAAFEEGEVPVGAVIVKDGRIACRSHNRCEVLHDPTAHAELLAMRQAYAEFGSLKGCTLYVTMEPCAMCTGAMIHLNLPRLVYGAFDKQNGCCGSRIDLGDHWFEHTVETIGGVCETECAALLSAFFANLRTKEF